MKIFVKFGAQQFGNSSTTRCLEAYCKVLIKIDLILLITQFQK
jgi:hypothetical protein